MKEYEQRWQASGTSPPNHQNCTKCGIAKQLGDFYRKGSRIDSQCKECVKAAKRKMRKEKSKQKKFMTSFEVLFASQPDRAILAERLRPLLEPQIL